MSLAAPSSSRRNRWLIIAVYVLYLIVLGYAMLHHELWGDEVHSWNIAKGNAGYAELIANIRYEGHPPVWYTIMWALSRFTHHLPYLQCLQVIIIAGAVFIIMFRSPLLVPAKVLISFGYYFLFEYAVLSRNYAVAMLLAFAVCSLISQRQKQHLPLYYLLLFLLSNTHMLGALAACSLHLYFLLQQREAKVPATRLLGHFFLGGILIMPSIYFILPPSDSEMNMQFWISKWNSRQLMDIVTAPVRSLTPMPAWWEYHFWNTHFLLQTGKLGNAAILLLSASLIMAIGIMLRHHRKSLYFFLFNLLLTCLVAMIFPLTSTRYVGFIYISVLMAAWMMYAEGSVAQYKSRILILFITLQIPGGVYAIIKDIQLPFSNAPKINELLSEAPPGATIVTDYWCLNHLVAFTDKPAYCLELNRELSFILWDKKLAGVMSTPTPYTNGAARLFGTLKLQNIYMISTNSARELTQKDSELSRIYQVELVGERTGAIEKYSNLYLYRISARH